ncbi:hypothetical protein Tco_0304416, partial [Tanacetum coccineum]
MSATNLRTQSSSVLQNHTVSSCSTSKVQEKTQLSRIKCMNSLRAIQSQLKFLIETLQDFGNMPIFKRTFSQDLDLLENHLTKQIISQTDCKTTLTKLRTTFENPCDGSSIATLNKALRGRHPMLIRSCYKIARIVKTLSFVIYQEFHILSFNWESDILILSTNVLSFG